MTTLREVMDEAAGAAVAGLPERADAARSATLRARQRRRVRALGAAGLLAVVVALAYALLPLAAGFGRQTVPPATPHGADTLPGTLGAPPPWLPDLSQTPVGRVGLVVSDGNGPYVVSADGRSEARLPGPADVQNQSGPLVSADGAVVAWPASSDFCAGLPGRLGWYVAGSGRVRSLDLTPGAPLGGAVTNVMVSPDGSQVLAQVAVRSDSEGCSAQVRMVLVDTGSGSVRDLTLATGLAAYAPLAWDSDSRSITFLASDAAWVGGPNHAVRCDLSGRVVGRFTISSTQPPQGVVVGLPAAPSAVPGSGGTGVHWAMRVPPDPRLSVWQVGLVPGVENRSSSYRTDFASFGPDGTYLGRRQGADVLSAIPVAYSADPPPQAVVLKARPGTATSVLIQGADGDQVIGAASAVIASARLGGPTPSSAPPWWSSMAVRWWVTTFWGWLVAIGVGLVALLSALRWRRMRPQAR